MLWTTQLCAGMGDSGRRGASERRETRGEEGKVREKARS